MNALHVAYARGEWLARQGEQAPECPTCGGQGLVFVDGGLYACPTCTAEAFAKALAPREPEKHYARS